jgi:uncharacterized coiled-coil protein SlyX
MRSFARIATAPCTPFSGTLILAAMVAGAMTMIALPASAHAGTQDQQSGSLGQIARQLRAQKQPSPASAKVWTNDNLPTNPFGISVVGPPPPPPEVKPVEDDAKAGEKPAATSKAKTLPEMEADLAQAQRDLDLQAKQLDLAKRDYTLQQQAFYANAMANQDAAGQAQLAEAQKQIDAMQQELDKATARVAEMRSKVDELKKGSPAPAPAAAAPAGSGPGN